jgi:hypothetical protein
MFVIYRLINYIHNYNYTWYDIISDKLKLILFNQNTKITN